MHSIQSFEGERYYFDVVAQTKGGKQTFEIRSTCVDSGASAIVTNVKEVMNVVLDGAKPDPRFLEPTWVVTGKEAEEFFDHTVSIFSDEEKLKLMEDAMNDDRTNGKWTNEEDFIGDDLAFDDEEDDEWGDLEPDDSEITDDF
ncbi:MAG: hypothetical protein JST20_04345 [Bacteroidetes bacterium]|nr:hypothetical protein [Bacteroidota bacterium]